MTLSWTQEITQLFCVSTPLKLTIATPISSPGELSNQTTDQCNGTKLLAVINICSSEKTLTTITVQYSLPNTSDNKADNECSNACSPLELTADSISFLQGLHQRGTVTCMFCSFAELSVGLCNYRFN